MLIWKYLIFHDVFVFSFIDVGVEIKIFDTTPQQCYFDKVSNLPKFNNIYRSFVVLVPLEPTILSRTFVGLQPSETLQFSIFHITIIVLAQ